jgi:hypothetical protein
MQPLLLGYFVVSPLRPDWSLHFEIRRVSRKPEAFLGLDLAKALHFENHKEINDTTHNFLRRSSQHQPR